MSDLSDLQGIYPTSLRFNAEDGTLGYSAYDDETGERTVKPLEYPMTFALDMPTRERGYGKIAKGFYDFRLSPVGSPPPPFPGDDFKPAAACWLWCPSLGELRLETNGAYFRQAISNLWDKVLAASEAAEGLQPVIRFTGAIETYNKKYDETFMSPKIEIVGWVKRDQVPGWAARTPTVCLPQPLPLLGSNADPATSLEMPSTLEAPPPSKVAPTAAQRASLRQAASRRGPKRKSLIDIPPKDPPDDPPFDDSLPDSLR